MKRHSSLQMPAVASGSPLFTPATSSTTSVIWRSCGSSPHGPLRNRIKALLFETTYGIRELSPVNRKFKADNIQTLNVIELPLWEILVPYKMGKHDLYRHDQTKPKSGRTVPLPYHQEWDARVIEITGGLTIHKTVRGQWVDDTGKLWKEAMIPVRIMCTEEQITEIAKFTIEWYQQQAVFVTRVSERALIFNRGVAHESTT